jgi:hypothetical protein
MSKRLQKHLASLELTKPGHRSDDSPVDVESVSGDEIEPKRAEA